VANPNQSNEEALADIPTVPRQGRVGFGRMILQELGFAPTESEQLRLEARRLNNFILRSQASLIPTQQKASQQSLENQRRQGQLLEANVQNIGSRKQLLQADVANIPTAQKSAMLGVEQQQVTLDAAKDVAKKREVDLGAAEVQDFVNTTSVLNVKNRSAINNFVKEKFDSLGIQMTDKAQAAIVGDKSYQRAIDINELINQFPVARSAKSGSRQEMLAKARIGQLLSAVGGRPTDLDGDGIPEKVLLDINGEIKELPADGETGLMMRDKIMRDMAKVVSSEVAADLMSDHNLGRQVNKMRDQMIRSGVPRMEAQAVATSTMSEQSPAFQFNTAVLSEVDDLKEHLAAGETPTKEQISRKDVIVPEMKKVNNWDFLAINMNDPDKSLFHAEGDPEGQMNVLGDWLRDVKNERDAVAKEQVGIWNSQRVIQESNEANRQYNLFIKQAEAVNETKKPTSVAAKTEWDNVLKSEPKALTKVRNWAIASGLAKDEELFAFKKAGMPLGSIPPAAYLGWWSHFQKSKKGENGEAFEKLAKATDRVDALNSVWADVLEEEDAAQEKVGKKPPRQRQPGTTGSADEALKRVMERLK